MVALSTPTEGAQIRYTTDGTAPSATVGTLLGSGETVSVDRTTTIRAVAYKPGWTDATVSSVYSFKVSSLTLMPPAGIYYSGQVVTLATPTEGAFIRYTTDGTTPSATAGTLLAGRRDGERGPDDDAQGYCLQAGLERHAGGERDLHAESVRR